MLNVHWVKAWPRQSDAKYEQWMLFSYEHFYFRKQFFGHYNESCWHFPVTVDRLSATWNRWTIYKDCIEILHWRFCSHCVSFQDWKWMQGTFKISKYMQLENIILLKFLYQMIKPTDHMKYNCHILDLIQLFGDLVKQM